MLMSLLGKVKNGGKGNVVLTYNKKLLIKTMRSF